MKARLLLHAICLCNFGAALLLSSGCQQKDTVHSTLSTTVDGREIKASIDSASSIQGSDSTATIRFQGHQVRVEKERLLFDGQERVKLDPATKAVHVVVTNKLLTVSADGSNVFTITLRK